MDRFSPPETPLEPISGRFLFFCGICRSSQRSSGVLTSVQESSRALFTGPQGSSSMFRSPQLSFGGQESFEILGNLVGRVLKPHGILQKHRFYETMLIELSIVGFAPLGSYCSPLVRKPLFWAS